MQEATASVDRIDAIYRLITSVEKRIYGVHGMLPRVLQHVPCQALQQIIEIKGGHENLDPLINKKVPGPSATSSKGRILPHISIYLEIQPCKPF